MTYIYECQDTENVTVTDQILNSCSCTRETMRQFFLRVKLCTDLSFRSPNRRLVIEKLSGAAMRSMFLSERVMLIVFKAPC